MVEVKKTTILDFWSKIFYEEDIRLTDKWNRGCTSATEGVKGAQWTLDVGPMKFCGGLVEANDNMILNLKNRSYSKLRHSSRACSQAFSLRINQRSQPIRRWTWLITIESEISHVIYHYCKRWPKPNTAVMLVAYPPATQTLVRSRVVCACGHCCWR